MIFLHPIKASTPDKTQNQISLFSRAIIKKPKNTGVVLKTKIQIFFSFKKDTIYKRVSNILKKSQVVTFAKVTEHSNNFSFSKESGKINNPIIKKDKRCIENPKLINISQCYPPILAKHTANKAIIPKVVTERVGKILQMTVIFMNVTVLAFFQGKTVAPFL